MTRGTPPTQPFFDQALDAADRLDAITLDGQTPADIRLVTRALREIIALNRGLAAENAGQAQAQPAQPAQPR